MSRISSKHKIENTNNRMTANLQEILQYCNTYGYRPGPNNELGVVLAKMQMLFYIRRLRKVPIPNEIMTLFKKINAFPTEKNKHRRDLLLKQASLRVARKNAFELKYKKIQKLTSLDLNVLKFICGREKFNRFVNTDIDIMATKAFLEFFENLFKENCSKREVIMIELFTGSRGGTSHWMNIENCSDKGGLLIAKYQKGEPLTIREISQLFSLSYESVRKTIKNAADGLRKSKTNLMRLLNVYLSGDVNAFMAELPSKKTEMYKYQKNMKLQDISSDVLNSVGKKLMAFFGKEKN